MNLDEILRRVFPPEGGDLGSSSMVQSREPMEQERVIRSDPQRQPSTREMTLEDFLVKAGVVVKAADKGARCVSPTASTDPVHASESYGYSRHWLQAYSGISESSSSISSSPLGEAVHRRLSSTQSLGGKQGISGYLGKQTAERKQKRMIKNRESAARSRARKQVCSLYLFFQGVYFDDIFGSWRFSSLPEKLSRVFMTRPTLTG